MTFAGYMETIKEKTGLGPRDFVALARKKGFATATTRATEIVNWLAADYGLGRGHAMAIVAVLKAAERGGKTTDDERIDKLFSAGKAKWRGSAQTLIGKIGKDIGTAPTDSYLGLTRDGRKFAILQPAAAHLDIGIKRKGTPPTGRFAEAGRWHGMVTHRVRVSDAQEIDGEVVKWLKAAYSEA
jgi:hypothetical protein